MHASHAPALPKEAVYPKFRHPGDKVAGNAIVLAFLNVMLVVAYEDYACLTVFAISAVSWALIAVVSLLQLSARWSTYPARSQRWNLESFWLPQMVANNQMEVAVARRSCLWSIITFIYGSILCIAFFFTVYKADPATTIASDVSHRAVRWYMVFAAIFYMQQVHALWEQVDNHQHRKLALTKGLPEVQANHEKMFGVEAQRAQQIQQQQQSQQPDAPAPSQTGYGATYGGYQQV